MNRRFLYVFILCIAAVVLFAACERANDPDQQLRRRLEAQAASEIASVTVSVGYIHQFQDPPETTNVENSATPPEPILRARTKNNEEIEITEFYLITSAVELHVCEKDYDPTFGKLERIQQWLIPSAYAHVPSSATRLGVPFVENLLAAQNQARIVGSIAPPVHNYCRLYAILSPADDDILNLTQLDNEQIEHKTMRVSGRFLAHAVADADVRVDADTDANIGTDANANDDTGANAGPQWQSFVLESTDRRVVEMKLIAPETGKQPLSLAASKGHALILIEKTVGHEIFDGLEAESLLDGTAASTILDRVISTFRIHEFSQEAL